MRETESTQKKRNRKPRRIQLTETQRWVAGIILLFFAIYLLFVSINYCFTWSADQSAVSFDSDDGAISNGGGSLGAKMGELLIGRGCGLFGLAVPVVLLILALRILRYRPAYLERSVRISLIAMLIGTITLGFAFGMKWGVFGSGLGGALGIYAAMWLKGIIGPVGTGLLLLCSWILLAVYINRRTISVVNRVGGVIADSGAKVGEATKEFVHHHMGGEASSHAGESLPEEDEQNPADETDKEETETIYSHEQIADDLQKELSDLATSEEEPKGDDSFFEITDSREQAEQERVAEEEPSGERTDDETPRTFSHGEFEVIDLGGNTPSSGNKLGPGGVVMSDVAVDENGMDILVPAQKDAEIEEDEMENLYDPLKELSSYRRPEIESILQNHSVDVTVTEEEVRANKDQIVQTLRNFGIQIDRIKATIGPTVTLYEIVPAAGVKISKIRGLEQDIALSLKALGIRIIAPIPGKGTIGIEVPNRDREIVSMYSVIKSIKFQDSKAELPIVLGKTIQNETFVLDLTKMPHLLVAGATGQGKSVGLNAIIASLLYKKHPAELKFVMVDPKKVELSLYARLEKHFLAKMESEEEAILTDTQKVVYTLNSLCNEMEARYELLRKAEVKKISEYNQKFINRRLNPKKGHRFLPYIVVVIDEFADMIMTAGKEVEQPITRLAQLARAVGIHLIIATQRPDVKVITGLIKANFPARIAFRVTSIVDSRTILDQTGANQLIGQGDMLVSLNGEITRVQCAFIDTPEIEALTEAIGKQRGYPSAYLLPDYVPEGTDNGPGGELLDVDKMFGEVARFVVNSQQGSTSNIQRHFAIGYNRAGRLMDQLERAGIVGRAEGSKPREVLVSDPTRLESILNDLGID